MQMKPKKYLCLLCLFHLVLNQQCEKKKIRPVILNDQADFYIGVLIDASVSGPGLTGCGAHLHTGIAQFEALRWSLNRINKRFGQIGKRIIHSSFIPGVTIGMRLFDICGHAERATEALSQLFPLLQEGEPCEDPHGRRTIGVIDLTGVTSRKDELALLLNNFSIPIVSAESRHVTYDPDLTEGLLLSLAELGWTTISILVEEKEPSIEKAKVLIHQSNKFGICLSSILKVNVNSDVLKTLETPMIKSDAIVLIATSREVLSKIDMLLKETEKLTELPHVAYLSYQHDRESNAYESSVLRDTKKWAMSFSPYNIRELEDIWQEYRDLNVKSIPDNVWTLDFLQQSNKCSLPLDQLGASDPKFRICQSLKYQDEEAQKLEDIFHINAAIHGFYIMVNAFKNAWRKNCKNRRGSCLKLIELTGRQFSDDFLQPLRFSHTGPGSRSPVEIVGRKVSDDLRAVLYNSSYGFYKLNSIGDTSVDQVFKISKGNLSVISQKIVHQYRLTNVQHCLNMSFSDYFKNPMQEHLSAGVRFKEGIFVPSEDNVYIVGLFPVHNPTENGTDCSHDINPETIQDVEAFLWSLDQINKQSNLLPNISIGGIILDTCGAAVKTMTQISSLIKTTLPGLPITVNEMLAFVTSLDSEASLYASEFLSDLNITSVNLLSSTSNSKYALKASPSSNKEAETMIRILEYMGWDYVILLTSNNNIEANFSSVGFKKMAKISKVCIADEIMFPSLDANLNYTDFGNQVVRKIKELVKTGATAIITYLTPTHLSLLETAIIMAKDDFIIKEVIFLGSSMWGSNKNKFQMLGELSSGIILLEDTEETVKEFVYHYKNIFSANSSRIPWINGNLSEKSKCRNRKCRKNTLPYYENLSSTRVIQVMFSFAASLTQLLEHLCPEAKGKLCPHLSKWRQRVVFNEFVRNTEISRVDNPEEYFHYTDEFHGNTPINILNLQRNSDNKPIYQKVGRYKGSKLTLSPIFGRFKNDKVPLNFFESSCVANCQQCSVNSPDVAFFESNDNLYIMAVIDVHEAGSDPFECGNIKNDQGIQKIETLLWALNQTQTQSGFEIGAIIFDTCSSKGKTARDITNLLSLRITDSLKKKFPSPKNVIGLVISTKDDISRQALEVSLPYGITSFSTSTQNMAISNNILQSLLVISPQNRILAECFISLMQFWEWKSLNVVYTDFGRSKEIFLNLAELARKRNIQIATAQALQLSETNMETMLDVWASIASGAQRGARVVVLLLETPHDIMFMQTAAKLHDENLIKSGDFIYMSTKSLQSFAKKKSEYLGSFVIQPVTKKLNGFENHFRSLSVKTRTNPYGWFQEFWSKIHDCRGAMCKNEQSKLNDSYTFLQAKSVSEINLSVKILSEALAKWRLRYCADYKNKDECVNKLLKSEYREEFFDLAKGYISEDVKFSANGYNSLSKLEILNFQGKPGKYEIKVVGYFTKIGGLKVNSSLVKAYDELQNEISLSDVKSECLNLEMCGRPDNHVALQSNLTGLHDDQAPLAMHVDSNYRRKNIAYAQIFPHHRLGISILLPFHQKVQDLFSCGKFFGDDVFQNLVAAIYAITEINRNNGDFGIGTIIFDYCDRIERAREQLFSYFSGDFQQINREILLTKDRIVASIVFDDTAASAVSSILSSNFVSQFSSPVGHHRVNLRIGDNIQSSVPTRSAEAHIYIDLLKKFSWTYVSVIYDDSIIGNKILDLIRRAAREENICISDSLEIPRRLSEEYALDIAQTLGIAWKPRVILLLIDDNRNIKRILEAFNAVLHKDEIIFLSGGSWGDTLFLPGNENFLAGAFTFSLESYELSGFNEFFNNLSLQNHGPVPKIWFQEYYQHRFNCFIAERPAKYAYFSRPCTGEEDVGFTLKQDPYVFHTILMVNTIAKGIESYVAKRCSNALKLNECEIIKAELVLEITAQADKYLGSTTSNPKQTRSHAYGYNIWNYGKRGNRYNYANVGKWKNGHISIDETKIKFKISNFPHNSSCEEGVCLSTCSLQSPIYAILKLPLTLPIDYNFNNLYGIITSSLSLIGIFSSLLFLIYFMVSYPSGEGTSILGYFILMGCLLIFSVNFAFIFQATIATCAIRRLLMGVAYAIVFSSMLMKSICSWKAANYPNEKYGQINKSILMLVNVAIVSIQVILASAWLILYPSQVDLIGSTYRCSPAKNFELELVISLSYVVLLIAATIFFCIETWSYNSFAKECQWVFLSSLFTTFTWTIWIIVATMAPMIYRDPSIVVGNLSCGGSILLFLFARRFYMYSHLHDGRGSKLHLYGDPCLKEVPIVPNAINSPFQRTSTINPIRGFENGLSFQGTPESSFRKVVLPPESTRSRHTSRASVSSKSSRRTRRSVRLSFSEDLPTNLNFESSEDEYAVDARPLSEDDSISTENEDRLCDRANFRRGVVASYRVGGFSRHHPSIRRVGSQQMLVFLTDGHSIGEVSRI